jgi:hypothetical protein
VSAADAVPLVNHFAARWVRGLEGGSNQAVAPLGVWPLLAILCAGSGGDAQRELEVAIGCPKSDALAILEELSDASSPIRAGVGVWAHPDVKYSTWWRSNVPPSLRHHLTGNTTSDQAQLDEWARTVMCDPRPPFPCVDDDTLLVAASALTVETDWLTPFDELPSRRREGPWEDREWSALVRRSRDLDEVAVADTPHGLLTFVSIATTDDLVVHIALGPEDATADIVLAGCIEALAGTHPVQRGSQLERALDAPGISWEVASFDREPTVMELIPRFSIVSSNDLVEHRHALGLAAAMDLQHGHFATMADDPPLAISAAQQDISVAFTPEGFRASIITAFPATAGGAPPIEPRSFAVVVDRPFGFVATTRDGAVLVTGWVHDPELFSWEGTGLPLGRGIEPA